MALRIDSPPFMHHAWQRLVRLPTSYHLLSAELELRGADTQTLSPVLRQARQRNLDRLRDYRLHREFPHNTHTPAHYSPCFMDHAGRLCAVAHFMHASGETAAVLDIARTANYARLAQMQDARLDAWAATSGLTKAELARIQPGYPPTLDMVQEHYASVTTAISVIAALGVLSVLTNTAKLTWAYFHRFTVLAGVLLGITLLYLGRATAAVGREFARCEPCVEGVGTFGCSLCTASVDVSTQTRRLQNLDISPYLQSLQTYETVALLVGVVSLLVAVLRIGFLVVQNYKTGAERRRRDDGSVPAGEWRAE